MAHAECLETAGNRVHGMSITIATPAEWRVETSTRRGATFARSHIRTPISLWLLRISVKSSRRTSESITSISDG
ncbi:hypothetical protein Y032_0026g1366 [Ancylostoma ceylanicum]|nr:hypothetical protein Y032_0026g1366 [Ancylostoma ceylanicum]